MKNEYIPFSSEILEIIKHNEIEYTFRLSYVGDVLPGQFFEVSIPMYGEAPISVSGIREGSIDLTIRKVGVVTDELFTFTEGKKLYLRGPYGNGFKVSDYMNSDLVIAAGGTGLSPVKAVIDYFSEHLDELKSLQLVVGFKDKESMLFREELKRWQEKFSVIITLDQSIDEPGYKFGYCNEHFTCLYLGNIKESNIIVVGPPVMMDSSINTFLNLGAKEENIWMSLERRMHCGIGICGHCRINSIFVCTDGPVFKYQEAKNLED